uniref:SPATA31 subfamily G member 1 n=1 Tax=Jaculus jaculus TaxID=51337 RepID=A0A8C5KWJ9_JACJA
MGLFQVQLIHALACRHCGSSTCLQSPGNLVILFLFMVWQIQRWWQLGRWQYLQPWYSGDMMKDKGQILKYLAFLDHLWKQKSEEEEKKEEESSFLDPLKPHSSSKEASIGKQGIIALPQPPCGSEDLYKATKTPEQIFTQPSSPFRSFPSFQILTNLPVRKIASGSCLQQRKSQLFWGLPSLHSESLETIFLSSNGPSPLKLSVCPSVFFNKVAFLPRYNLLFSSYRSLSHYFTPEAHSMDGPEGMVPGSELLPSLSSPPVPSLSFHLKPLPMDHKGASSDAEAHTQWPSQHRDRDVPLVSGEQVLHSQPEVQRIRSSNLLSSSEAWRGTPQDPSLHQHKPESPSTSLLYPCSPLGVLTSFEAPQRIMRQNEHPKASESTVPTPSPTLASLSELQNVNPTEDLSGYKAVWETTAQKENPQISRLSTLALCQPILPITEPQETGPPGIPTEFEAQWGAIDNKDSPQISEPLMPASCQPSVSLSEFQKVVPKGLSAHEDLWKTTGYREGPQVAKFPVPAPCLPTDSQSELQKESPLEDLSGYESPCECQENSGNLWASETPALDLNTGLYETSSACVSSGSETQRKGRQRRENLWVSTDQVSSPNLPSESLPESVVTGLRRALSEPKTLWETKNQREDLWMPDTLDLVHRTPFVPFIELQRINTMDGFPISEATQKGTGHSKDPWVSDPPSSTLSPSLAPALQSFRFSPIVGLFNSKTRCENSRASGLPAESIPQHLYGASPMEVLSDSEPVGEVMKQKENCCVPVSPVRGPSPPLNSVSKSHISEPTGDQCNCKPIEAVEQRKGSWITELSTLSSLSFPSQEPHSDLEFVSRKVQERKGPMGPSPPPTWSLYPAKFPIQPGLQKEMLSEAKVGASSSQSEAVSEVLTHPQIHAWQWSTELKLKLKKLQQSPAFKCPDPKQSHCSLPALNSTTPDSQGLSSCSPHNHPLSLYPYASSNHSKTHNTVPQPFQTLHNSHSSSQPQVRASGRAEQESQKKERMKGKVVAHIPFPGQVYVEAGKKCSGLGELSNPGVLASGKRQNKTLVIQPSAPKRVSPRKPQAGKCGGGKQLHSPNVAGNSHHAQAWKLAEVPVSFSKRSHYRGQSCPQSALPQQFLPKDVAPQDGQQVGLVAGHIQKPHHCKHCPWTHMEKHLPLPKPQAPFTRRFQRVLAKFLGTHGSLPIKS